MSHLYRRWVIALIVIFSGCALYAKQQLDAEYGAAGVQQRIAEEVSGPEFYRDIKPIFDQRCVLCHGCYDAPCQLKLSSVQGLDRGASKAVVYDGTRLLAANLTRLFIDAQTTEQWREKDFYPVLNEREQSPKANLAGSQLYQLLKLKQQHPLPSGPVLPDSFDFSLARDQQCPTIEEFSQFSRDYPLWGMPYGLPAIEEQSFATIESWIENGAKAQMPPPLESKFVKEIARWETFLNGDSLKQQLVARYIYEHLFLANVYFSELDNRRFFKLVRSTTPPGQPVNIVATRRPFDDPGVDRVFYRFMLEESTILAKSHLPYRLDDRRFTFWQRLFFQTDYEVRSWPGYRQDRAANPFAVFSQLPVQSRYRFMLEEAQFTIMNFIKGPVCRGQVALNVINDQFWVFFTNPENEWVNQATQQIDQQADSLQLPAESSSNASPIDYWTRYEQSQRQYLEARNKVLAKLIENENSVGLDLLWDGDGHNENAALTIFRHFDAATVEKGLHGNYPKTAWVIGYSLLERIHYLLVAGFDVYGNVGHQLLTRLYMDFLRMEGEANFLALLPTDVARRESQSWYQGDESRLDDYLHFINSKQRGSDTLVFKTDDPKKELFDRIARYLGEKVAARDAIYFAKPRTDLELNLYQLGHLQGKSLQFMPESSILRLEREGGSPQYFSLILNRAHSNISTLFLEKYRLLVDDFSLSLVQGVVGNYPNAFYRVQQRDLPDFSEAIKNLGSEQDYSALMDRFGIRRIDPKFWLYSDQLHRAYEKDQPIEYGVLDYNRLQNR